MLFSQFNNVDFQNPHTVSTRLRSQPDPKPLNSDLRSNVADQHTPVRSNRSVIKKLIANYELLKY